MFKEHKIKPKLNSLTKSSNEPKSIKLACSAIFNTLLEDIKILRIVTTNQSNLG